MLREINQIHMEVSSTPLILQKMCIKKEIELGTDENLLRESI